MKLKYTLYLCLCLFAHATLAQQAYAPEKLSASVNSPYPEINPVLSPDGRTLFFVRANHPENTFGTQDTQDIWYSELQQDGGWTEAKRMPGHLNKNRYNAIFGVYNQGNTLLLHGRYNKKGNIWKKRGFSVSEKTESGWSLPKPLKVSKLARKSKGLYTTATVSDDGKYLLVSYGKGYNSQRSKMYISILKENGTYSTPKKLKNMNDGGWKEAPFLSPDGKTLYFTDNLTGNYQIFKSERLDDSGRSWSEPQAVNDSVNTFAWESYFRTNFEGDFGYFSRNIKKSGADIYKIKLLETKPYLLVKGRVLSSSTQQPLPSETEVSFLANNVKIDSAAYTPGTGQFELYLPFGRQYELKAVAYSHKDKAANIDGTGVIEFTEIEKNLYLEPILVVKVEGQLLIRSSNTPLPAATSPKILVNGIAPDSVHIDPVTNRYQLWLPYGKDYTAEVQVNGFETEQEKLQLSHINGYQEINKNLFVDTKRMASVNGTIFDKKTGKPFAAEVPLQIFLNDSIEANIIIDGDSRNFQLELPLGTSYVINAKAEGYYPMFETIDLSKEEQNIKVLKDLYLAPLEVGQSIRLNNIFFETGKAELKTESFPELDRVVTFLQDNSKLKIEIAGHTDNVGGASANKKLSAARAKAVEKYIIMKGINEDRISFKGYGSTKPEADNTTDLGRSLNRRVEFTILEIVK